MMYGELAKQNTSYQTGHNTGSLRACGYMQNRFDEIVRENPRKRNIQFKRCLPCLVRCEQSGCIIAIRLDMVKSMRMSHKGGNANGAN